MTQDILFHRSNRFIWNLLAFQGGVVNVAGFLAVHQFVSHVTGFAGRFALFFYEADWRQAFFAATIPVGFLAGAFFSALFTEVRRQRGQAPIYIRVMATIGTIYLGIAVAGHLQAWGEFGEPLKNTRDFLLLLMLSFACGAQNALFTHYSDSIIRTTHLTGLTTDLGIGFAKQFICRDRSEIKVNRVRVELILSFLVGSIFGVALFHDFFFFGFLFVALVSYFVSLRLYWTRLRFYPEAGQ